MDGIVKFFTSLIVWHALIHYTIVFEESAMTGNLEWASVKQETIRKPHPHNDNVWQHKIANNMNN